MRLLDNEVASIKSAAKEFFGIKSRVFLFGSRVDDNQRGGDIDLYICPEKKDQLLERKVNFLIKLQSQIGEQKIDVVLAKDKSRLIEQEALKKGVPL